MVPELSTCVVWDMENLKDPEVKLDIPKQQRLIELGRGTNVTHVAFVGNFQGDYFPFGKFLKRKGFIVYDKRPKTVTTKEGDTYREVDMDGEIVGFLLSQTEHFNSIVLVSGDGDMCQALDILRDRGKHVSVYAIKDRLSKKLLPYTPQYITGVKHEPV